jgi:hypothetical protein
VVSFDVEAATQFGRIGSIRGPEGILIGLAVLSGSRPPRENGT